MNGLNTIDFVNANSQYFTEADSTITKPATDPYFRRLQIHIGKAYQQLFFKTSTGAFADGYALGDLSGAGTNVNFWIQQLRDSRNRWTPALNAWNIGEARFDGSKYSTGDGSGTRLADVAKVATINHTTTVARIGGGVAGVAYLDGGIAHVLMTSALSDSERAIVRTNYIGAQWGLT